MKELNYREPVPAVPANGKRFSPWLNELRNMSGAYVIRRKSDHQVLYVGESHTGRLAATVKRHFNKWDDTGGREHFTASRHSVEVAVRTTPPTTAKAAQNNLIQRLQPKRNVSGFVYEPGF